MSDRGNNETVQPDDMTMQPAPDAPEALTADSAAALPPTPPPRAEDAYAVVFDAICRDVLPKTPEFQHFVTEFMNEKKRLQETSAGRAVVQQLQKDLAQPAPSGGPSPTWRQWEENQRRCKVFLGLMGARLGDLHEPGQQPNVWPLTLAEVAEGSEQEEDPSAKVEGGEGSTTELETTTLFRKVTPDDARLRLPTALDWLVNGIPVRTPWGPRRMPIPIAGIFRGMV